jgi:50S ribosomal subunit-associated GTPase HflX
MFVVDSANHSRLEEAIQEFNKILPEDNLKDVPILIVANKQDLPEALETQEIWKQFKIAEIKQPVAVLSTSAITGVGVHEAFDWFVNRIKRKIQEQEEEEEY